MTSRLLITIGLVALVTGCSGVKDSPRGSPPAPFESPPPPWADPERKPDFTIDSQDLAREFLKDLEAAGPKYIGKYIELRGVVAYPAVRPIPGGCILVLEGWTDPDSLDMHAQCSFWDRDQDKKAWALTRGEHVIVRGICARLDLPAIKFHDCMITSAADNPILSVSAEEVAQALLQNSKAAEAKYEGKVAMVEGTITARDRESYHVLLTGNVTCHVDMDRWFDLPARTGEKIRLKGVLSVRGGQVYLDHAVLVE